MSTLRHATLEIPHTTATGPQDLRARLDIRHDIRNLLQMCSAVIQSEMEGYVNPFEVAPLPQPRVTSWRFILPRIQLPNLRQRVHSYLNIYGIEAAVLLVQHVDNSDIYTDANPYIYAQEPKQ